MNLRTHIRLILGEERQKMVQYESDNLSPTLADLVKIERKEALEEGVEQGLKNVALRMLQEDFESRIYRKTNKVDVAEVEKLKEAQM